MNTRINLSRVPNMTLKGFFVFLGEVTLMKQHLQKLCDDLCQQYGVSKHTIIVDSHELHGEENIGEYHLWNKEIVISDTLTPEETVMAIYHEFRHAWQFENPATRSIYAWWMNKKRKNIYRKYYFSLLNSIEADAYLFGVTYGKQHREDCLFFFAPEDLDFMESVGQLDLGLNYMESELPACLNER